MLRFVAAAALRTSHMVDFPMRCPGVQVDSCAAIRRSSAADGPHGGLPVFPMRCLGVQVGSGVAIRRSRLQTGYLSSRVAEPLIYVHARSQMVARHRVSPSSSGSVWRTVSQQRC